MESNEYKKIHDLVYNYKTKYEEGFTGNEQKELLKLFPDINTGKYHNAMSGNTCVMRDGKLVEYHCDVLKALLCGLENRDLTLEEWD